MLGLLVTAVGEEAERADDEIPREALIAALAKATSYPTAYVAKAAKDGVLYEGPEANMPWPLGLYMAASARAFEFELLDGDTVDGRVSGLPTPQDRGKPGGYDRYTELLTHLIRDVRRELSAPKLPFVIGVLGVGGPVAGYGSDQQRYRAIHQIFRDAMAAPAANPELGSVTAVLTERFWDGGLTALRARDAKIRKPLEMRRKQGERTREQEKAELETQRAEAFSPRERILLEKGVSNAEYHDLGSAKILSRIGQAFADALLKKVGDR